MTVRTQSRSVRVAILSVTMIITFSVVFVITYFGEHAIRKRKNELEEILPESTTVTPKEYSSTSPNNVPKTFDPTVSNISTVATTVLSTSSTTQKTLVPTLLPISHIMEWVQIGESIDGRMKDFSLYNQPVAMSYDGNRVVLGSAWDHVKNRDPATVNVLDFDGIRWTDVGHAFSGQNRDKFGQTIALSGNGNRIAIASSHNNDVRGRGEFYELGEGNIWTELGEKIIGEQDDLFGYSLSMSEDGSHVAIGAPWSSLYGENSGYAQIFEFIDDTWKEKGQVIKGEADGDFSGTSVSISSDGNIVAIGAPNSDENGDSSGSVRVFQYSSNKNEWKQLGQKLLGDSSSNDFGEFLSLNANGNILAVAAPNNDRGDTYVKIFQLKNSTWETMGQTLVRPDQLSYACTLSIAPSFQRIAIGAPRGKSGGYVDIFDYNGIAWEQKWSILSESPGEREFGSSVSMSSSGNQIAVGSIFDDGLFQRGRLNVYELK